MWRAQVAYLQDRGTPVTAVDLPGHGSRMSETFTLEGAFETIDGAVREAAERGPVLLVGHSMGGLLCIEYAGRSEEHTSELQSLMRISYAVFCLKKKKNT